MKCNFPQKSTVYELLAIQKRWPGSKKVRFWQKSVQKKFNKNFKKPDFFQKSTFFESPITQKRSIFEHSYVSYGKRPKRCTLIVI